MARRSIIDALGDRTIHIPRHAWDKLSAINRAEAELTTLTPGAVTPAAIAERAHRRVVAVIVAVMGIAIAASPWRSRRPDGKPTEKNRAVAHAGGG